MAGRLDGKRILILETREEAQFSRLLAEQGAEVLQCPMFTIEDAPDPNPVAAWIGRAIARPLDDLVLTTGEGLRRVMKLARAHGQAEAFVASLASTRTFARGPKPGRALREIGLQPHVTTQVPTSDGIVAMLQDYDLAGRRVGLQLYPEKDHRALIGAIEARGAQLDSVAPYIYDDSAARERIAAAVTDMAAGRVDAIALTSSGQLRRLFDAAKATGSESQLVAALRRTPIASVGPVVSEELAAHGLAPTITPAEGAYFMKPLISAMAERLKS
jgi:uroporphyrinogen-III synthase